MVLPVKKPVALLGHKEVTLSFKGNYSADVFGGVQKFIDAVPELKVGQSFFWGMWPVKLDYHQGEIALLEYDFSKQKYVENIDHAARLWQEQSNVCTSQGLSWFSAQLDDHVFFTPNAFNTPMLSTTEGVRDEPDTKDSSGWFIYTAADREGNFPFQSASLGTLLQQYNLNILRFMGLPTGWMFNIEMNGASHVWNETQQSAATH